MTFDVAINGRSWRIAIDAAVDNERSGARLVSGVQGSPRAKEERGRFVVTLKGQKRVVDAVWIDPETISLIVVDAGSQGGVSNSAREVGVRSLGPGEMEVSLGGRLFRATVGAAGSAAQGTRGGELSSRGPGREAARGVGVPASGATRAGVAAFAQGFGGPTKLNERSRGAPRVIEERGTSVRAPSRGWGPAPLNNEGRQSIVAPMPGRVVRVLVKPGDRISAGQGVVIVEAMKMENELRSPKDGVVREVKAIEGTAVEAGAVLVVIE